jgi:hypothetical protein
MQCYFGIMLPTTGKVLLGKEKVPPTTGISPAAPGTVLLALRIILLAFRNVAASNKIAQPTDMKSAPDENHRKTSAS